MNIGVLGPEDSVNKICEFVKEHYPQVTLNLYIQEKVVDTVSLFDQCQEENDGIFFTGIAVMETVGKMKEIHKPAVSIPRSGYSLMSALWEMARAGVCYDRVSIDVVPQQVLNEVIDEFKLSFESLFVMPYSSDYDETYYEKSHKKLYVDEKIDIALTGFGGVYRNLQKQGIPTIRLHPNAVQIRKSLDKLIYKIETQGMHFAGIAIQIIQLQGVKNDSLCQYQDLKKRGIFYSELLEYVQGVRGSLFAFTRNEMVIFTTRGEVENANNQKLLMDLTKWSQRKNITFSSGIGLGMTAYDAERSARKALAIASNKQKISTTYMYDGEFMKGPILEDNELAYCVKEIDDEILKKAESIGVAPSYIRLIQAHIKKSSQRIYDTDELSIALNIGERTARTILRKLVDAGYGVIKERESYSRRGRPKNRVEILI